jgi:hypothetical protein
MSRHSLSPITCVPYQAAISKLGIATMCRTGRGNSCQRANPAAPSDAHNHPPGAAKERLTTPRLADRIGDRAQKRGGNHGSGWPLQNARARLPEYRRHGNAVICDQMPGRGRWRRATLGSR